MINKKTCPAEFAGILDVRARRLFQNPTKILSPYINAGMTVIDMGCGPGFFTLDIAKLLNGSGQVIAVDMQQIMLNRINNKIKNTNLESIIQLVLSDGTSIPVNVKADFLLAFYVVHELPDQKQFFQDIKQILKTGGRVLIAEPLVHVKKNKFNEMLNLATGMGFKVVLKPKIFYSRAVILETE